jgi:hypothetical protein
MEEFKYGSKTYTDSVNLYKHLITFKNAQDDYGDGEFAIKINYSNTKDLIEFIDHVKDFYGNYDGDGWVETIMEQIWTSYNPSEEQEKIFDESYDYWKKKSDNEK